MFKTLNKTTWDKIKVGEVFAAKFNNTFSGISFTIFVNDNTKFPLELSSSSWSVHYGGSKDYSIYILEKELYKIPISLQRLWKEE